MFAPSGFGYGKFLKKLKILLYFWVNLWYLRKAGQRPDAIIMPVAQLWDKAIRHTTRPYLAPG